MEIALRKNEKHIVDITDLTYEGFGVCHVNNMAVFVDGLLVGEMAEIKIVKVHKRYAYGIVEKILVQSPDRVNPPCDVFKSCGGCSIQHMNYEAQLRFKRDLVRMYLDREGFKGEIDVRDTIGMEWPFNYRNKVQLPVAIHRDRIKMGFYAKRSHMIIEHETCPIQDESFNKIEKAFKKYLIKSKNSIYDEKTGKGLIRHLVLRRGFSTGEILVIIVINGDRILDKNKLVKDLLAADRNIKGIVLNINKSAGNVVLGNRNINIFGDGYIVDSIGRFKFYVSAGSFFQINTEQAEVLYEQAVSLAKIGKEDVVLDLYCGIGTISAYMADRALKVIGVESVEDAVKDAVRNARLNNQDNLEFIHGDVNRILPELANKGIKPDVIVLDPPRKGCDEDLLSTVVSMEPDKIVYVSCNPATLVRDIKFLWNKGYRTGEIQPVDMFPQTTHVETVVLMSRKDK